MKRFWNAQSAAHSNQSKVARDKSINNGDKELFNSEIHMFRIKFNCNL